MFRSARHIRFRRGLPALALAAAAFAVPTSAHASTVPTVNIDMRDQGIAVSGAEDLGRGPVRLHLSGETLTGSRTVAVVELEPGVTAHTSEHALEDLQRLGRLVAGGTVSAGTDHVTTITARAREHLVVDVTGETAGSARFRVGAEANGARLPRSAVTIGLRDRGFYLPSLLPAGGVIRIANQGELPHQATAYRLKRTASFSEAVEAAIRGRFLERFGAPTVLTGLVSGGTVNRVEADLRPGRYLVVSHYAPLTATGRPDVLRGLVATTRVR
jgi:hypothetical protein